MFAILVYAVVLCLVRHCDAIPTNRLFDLDGFEDSTAVRRAFSTHDFKGKYSRFMELTKGGHLCPETLDLLSNGVLLADDSVEILHMDTALNKEVCHSDGSVVFHFGKRLASETIEDVFKLPMDSKGIEAILRNILVEVKDFYYGVEEDHINCGGASLFPGTVVLFTSDSSVFGNELRLPFHGHPKIAFLRDEQKSCAYNGTWSLTTTTKSDTEKSRDLPVTAPTISTEEAMTPEAMTPVVASPDAAPPVEVTAEFTPDATATETEMTSAAVPPPTDTSVAVPPAAVTTTVTPTEASPAATAVQTGMTPVAVPPPTDTSVAVTPAAVTAAVTPAPVTPAATAVQTGMTPAAVPPPTDASVAATPAAVTAAVTPAPVTPADTATESGMTPAAVLPPTGTSVAVTPAAVTAAVTPADTATESGMTPAAVPPPTDTSVAVTPAAVTATVIPAEVSPATTATETGMTPAAVPQPTGTSIAVTPAAVTSRAIVSSDGTPSTDTQSRGTETITGVQPTVTPSPVGPKQQAAQDASETAGMEMIEPIASSSTPPAKESTQAVVAETAKPDVSVGPSSSNEFVVVLPSAKPISSIPSGETIGDDITTISPMPGTLGPDVSMTPGNTSAIPSVNSMDGEEVEPSAPIPVDLMESASPSSNSTAPGSAPFEVSLNSPPPMPSPTTPPNFEISVTESDSSPEPSFDSSPEPSFDSFPEPSFASGSVGASPTPSSITSSTGSSTSDDGSTCFPAHALARLSSGKNVRMDKLRVGDLVHVGKGIVSAVVGFSHSDSLVLSRFVKFTTDSGKSVAVTPTHFMYTSRGLVAGAEIAIGDYLRLEDGRSTKVTGTEMVLAKGLFNPHTSQGDVVVDGFIASTYTSAVEPNAAHALLSAVRALERLGLRSSIVSVLSSSRAIIHGVRSVLSVQ